MSVLVWLYVYLNMQTGSLVRVCAPSSTKCTGLFFSNENSRHRVPGDLRRNLNFSALFYTVGDYTGDE